MSKPGSAETQTETFEQQVGSAVSQMVQGEDGKFKLPDGLSDEVKFAANAERRRRDTESVLSKTRAQLAQEQAVKTELEKRVVASVAVTPEVQDELDELKVSDPDAWRVKMNALEQDAATTLRQELDTAAATAGQQTEQERRAGVLAKFNQVHPDMPVTDQSLEADIPPRITQKLANGTVTFEAFLQEAHDYMAAVKTTQTDTENTVTNLGDVGGSSTPSKTAVVEDFSTSYASTTF